MDGVKFSEQLARRVIKATRTVEGWTPPATGRMYPQKLQPDNQLWYNSSGETAPPYAAIEVTDVSEEGGRIVLTGTKPTGASGVAIVFNGREEVEAARLGPCCMGPLVRARYANGSGANGVMYSVAASSWVLATGSQYPSLGTVNGTDNDMLLLINSASVPIRVAMTQDGGADGDQITAASWTYTIKDLDDNELDTAHNPLTSPSMCVNPISPGRVTPATAGIAWVDGEGVVSVYYCNHTIAGAPCG